MGEQFQRTTLFGYGSAFNLSSFDPDCLSVLVFNQFVGFHCKREDVASPFVSTTGELPVLCDGENSITGSHSVIEYLQSRGFNLDYWLSSEQKAQCETIWTLLDKRLRIVLMWDWWFRLSNFEIIREAYKKPYTFPLNLLFPRWIRARNYMTAKLYLDLKEIEDENKTELLEKETNKRIETEGAMCFETLSKLLSNQSFFFGEKISSIDCLIFGFLECIRKVPTTVGLSKEIQKFANLVSFCDRMNILFEQTKSGVSQPIVFLGSHTFTKDGKQGVTIAQMNRNIDSINMKQAAIYAVVVSSAMFSVKYVLRTVDFVVAKFTNKSD